MPRINGQSFLLLPNFILTMKKLFTIVALSTLTFIGCNRGEKSPSKDFITEQVSALIVNQDSTDKAHCHFNYFLHNQRQLL